MTDHVRMTCATGDEAAARRLAQALRDHGTEVEVEVDGTGGGREERSEPMAALIYLVSEGSIEAPGCLAALERAVALGSRIVPVVLQAVVDRERWPSELAGREWVLADDGDPHAPWLQKLVEALESDPRARDEHARIAERARAWDSSGRDRSRLLRGADLADAEAWLAAEPEHRRAPTAVEASFVAQSRRAAVARQRTGLAVVLGALAVTVGLAVVALIQREEANTVERASTARRLSVQATSLVRDDPALAAALAVEASRVDAGGPAADAVAAALAALGPDIGLLVGHADSVMRVAWLGRTGRLVSASGDATVRIWDVATRSQVGAPLRGHAGAVFGVAASADGTMIASGGADGTVRLWSVARHRQIGPPLRGHAGAVSTVAFSPDGALLASGGDDRTVRIWDVARGVAAGPPLRGNARSVGAVAFAGDGRLVASGGADGTVRLWDVAGRRASGPPLRGHAAAVTTVAFAPDGRTLASGSLDETVALWDVATRRRAGRPLRALRPPLRLGVTGPIGVGAVAFSPDGRTLLAADTAALRRWDVRSHAPVGPPIAGVGTSSIAVSADGRTVATPDIGAGIRLLNVARGDAAAPTQRLARQPLNARGPAINDVAFSADGRRRVSAGADGLLRLWDVAANAPLGAPLRGHEGSARGVAMTRDATTIASAGDDATVRLWSASTRREIRPALRAHRGRVWCVAFSRDGRLLASGGDDGLVRLWDVRTGRQVGAPLRGHTSPVKGVAFSPDGKTLASVGGGLDRSLRLWTVATGAPIGAPLRGHTEALEEVTFSPDGRLLATSGLDATVRLWDVAGRHSLGSPLEGHVRPVTHLAFSADSRVLASAGFDASFRLWDVGTRSAIGPPLADLGEGIAGIAFAPGARGLVVADGGDAEATVDAIAWRGRGDARAARLCAAARRDLSRPERRTYLPGEPYDGTCSRR